MSKSHPLKKQSLHTKVIKRIEEISPDEFNSIYPKVPEGYYFLKTLDESNFDQYSFYYILVYNSEELVGIAPCFTKIYKILANLLTIKALICGIPMGQGQIANPPYSFDIVEAIVKRMEALALKLHSPIIAFKDFDQSYDDLFSPLLKDNFLKINGLPMTSLALDFIDFEDYLKILSGATRHDLRRKLKKSASVPIELDIIYELDEITLPEAYALYLNSLEQHGQRSQTVPQDFFRLISTNIPDRSRYFLFRINGKLAAFVFCLILDDVLIDYYLGFDYTLAHEYHLYFLKFKEIFEWGLKNGIKTYEMGQMGYEPKRRLKFNLVAVYSYIKSQNKFLQLFIKIFKFYTNIIRRPH